MVHFPRVRPPYRAVFADPAIIPPVPCFLYQVDNQLHWGVLPVGADGTVRLVDDAHLLADALHPEVRISSSGLNVVDGKSASTINEKSTSIQAESFIFCKARAQSARLRLNPCALARLG